MSYWSASAPRMEEHEVEQERDALTPQERERAKNDLAGVDMEPTPETNELIVSSKARLVQELHAIPDQEKEAFLKATQQCPDYVMCDDFLLKFLRADRFDASAAARRICRYWTTKLKAFGPERAFGPVTLESLTAEEREVWLRFCINGGSHVLPGTDKAGRACIFLDRGTQRPENASEFEHLRVRWYLIHVALEKVSTQRNGIVVVVYTPESFAVDDFHRKRSVQMITLLNKVLPVRITAYRQIIKSKSSMIVLPFIFKAIGAYLRARTKLYVNESAADATDDLVATGFDLARLPRCIGGTYTPDYNAWCQERQSAEQPPQQVSDEEEEEVHEAANQD